MITKEQNFNKKCLFCASDYHLEMILLPYIIENKDKYKSIIFTETSLEKSINVLLTKVNLKKEDKEIIKSLEWKGIDELKINNYIKKNNEKIIVIINGSYNYIKYINKIVNEINSKDIEIINCFHIEDPEVDITNISKEYNVILNTQKIKK